MKFTRTDCVKIQVYIHKYLCIEGQVYYKVSDYVRNYLKTLVIKHLEDQNIPIPRKIHNEIRNEFH